MVTRLRIVPSLVAFGFLTACAAPPPPPTPTAVSLPPPTANNAPAATATRTLQPAAPTETARPPAPTPTQTVQPTASLPAPRFIAGSSVKVAQLIGEEDKELHKPTISQTFTRYGMEGADLGYSFDHQGGTYFLFGDTVGKLARALDSIGYTDSTDPEQGLHFDMLMNGSGYLTVQPPGIKMGAFEVPVAGISVNGQMYVVVTTDHSDDYGTDRSVLTKFTLPSTFQPLRTISQLPAGRFTKMSMHLEPTTIPGLPSGGPYILVWGTGAYRMSDAYLSIVPAANLESGQGTRYYAGLDAAGAPRWSEKESDSAPIVKNGTLGDLSVTWSKDLNLWLMTYDSRLTHPTTIQFSYSRTPWGPWSEPQTIFNGMRDADLARSFTMPVLRQMMDWWVQ